MSRPRHVRIRKPKGPVVEFDEFEETRQEEVDTGPNQSLIARLQAYGVETKTTETDKAGKGASEADKRSPEIEHSGSEVDR